MTPFPSIDGKTRAALAALVALLASSTARNAAAFCRTTTCDLDIVPTPAQCVGNGKDADGCSTLGAPLHWPGRCSWFGVEQGGSKLRGVPYETFHEIVQRAFEKWASVDCGGGKHPSFDMTDTDALYGAAACNTPEFDGHHPDASVWMFQDSSWTHSSSGVDLAITNITAEVESGKILDADVEINSFQKEISTSDTDVTNDLESIVTHEAGHYLGLAHSADKDATMYTYYSPQGVAARDLGDDDRAGICAIYPPSTGAPSCGEPEPEFGFSRYCGGVNPSTTPKPPEAPADETPSGCAVSGGPPHRTMPVWPFLVVASAVIARRSGTRRRFVDAST